MTGRTTEATATEQESELEHFTELEHILRLAKARARQILLAQR